MPWDVNGYSPLPVTNDVTSNRNVAGVREPLGSVEIGPLGPNDPGPKVPPTCPGGFAQSVR